MILKYFLLQQLKVLISIESFSVEKFVDDGKVLSENAGIIVVFDEVVLFVAQKYSNGVVYTVFECVLDEVKIAYGKQ